MVWEKIGLGAIAILPWQALRMPDCCILVSSDLNRDPFHAVLTKAGNATPGWGPSLLFLGSAIEKSPRVLTGGESRAVGGCSYCLGHRPHFLNPPVL